MFHTEFDAMNLPSGLAPWLRYHALGPEALFEPIAFGLVTDRMCAEILAERQRIMSLTPPARRQQQRSLLAQYDPEHRAAVYRSLLRPFCEGGAESRAN